MPKGHPKKKEAKPDLSVNGSAEKETQPIVEAPKPSKKVWPLLAAGQKYFVDPLTDEHVIGDETKDTILFRPKDGRKPFHINPKR